MIIRKANVGRGICPRVPFIELLLLVLVCVLAACANNSKATEQYPDVRDYVMQDSEEPVKPTVSLKNNNKFIFTYSLLSSYFAVGSYEVNDGSLILRTDDGRYKYVFEIKDDSLIFNAAESSEIPSYANVPDGAVFR